MAVKIHINGCQNPWQRFLYYNTEIRRIHAGRKVSVRLQGDSGSVQSAGHTAIETVMYLLNSKMNCEYTDNLFLHAKLIDNYGRISYYTINKGTQEQYK